MERAAWRTGARRCTALSASGWSSTTAGYEADHWCEKGHILLCLEGELLTELRDGRTVRLAPGMSYEVADGAEPHRSTSPLGAKLFIVD